jgi:hypothetical protein
MGHWRLSSSLLLLHTGEICQRLVAGFNCASDSIHLVQLHLRDADQFFDSRTSLQFPVLR